jgi:hypothetical protein
MINYTWNVTNLLTETIEGKQDYVVVAGYNVEATDGNYSANTGFYAIQFSTESVGDFIPYSELTTEIVVSWIKETLGESGVFSLEESLKGQIESQINPPQVPVNTPLPWETHTN